MCVAKTPKVKEQKPKDPAIIRNPYLDGLDPISKALRVGRSSLRIERAGSGAASAAPPATAAPLPSTATGLPPVQPVLPKISRSGWVGAAMSKVAPLQAKLSAQFK